MDKFDLEKSLWTEEDFEFMGWHDSNIYGMIIEKSEENWTADFILDIDYIFKWVHPIPPNEFFTFWVSPCTLKFNDCFDLKIDIKTIDGCLELIEIDDLRLVSKVEQSKNKYVYEWLIELQQSQISLKSYGFQQFVRKQPIHMQSQVLSLTEREGINFGQIQCL